MATAPAEVASPAGFGPPGPATRSWSTAAVPAREQFSYWREVICEAFTALDPTCSSSDRFESHVVQTDFGGTLMSDSISAAQSIVRGRREISRTPTEGFFLNYQLSGTCRVEQGDRQILVQPGQFYLVDTTRPFRQEYSDWHVLCFFIPGHQLAPHLKAGETITAIPICDSDGGIGTIAGSYMRSLQNCSRGLGPVARHAVATGLADLIGGTFGQLGAQERSTRQVVMDGLFEAIREHVVRVAADPELSAPSVATRFRISTRTLHRLFESHQTSFAQMVMTERLKRAAGLLGDPANHQNISDIALRCGFNDLSNFCRTFKQRMGASATGYRQAVRAGALPTVTGR